MNPGHQQVHLNVEWPDGRSREANVDEGIAPFIAALWAAGINTRMSCEAFEDGSGRVWVVFATAADAQRFRRLGRRHRRWPPVVPITLTAADFVDATAPDDFAVGDRVWYVLFPRRHLPAVLARLRAAGDPVLGGLAT